jgi:hypothetical protein
VRAVWIPEEEDWSQLPHQRDIIGFEPPTIGGGTAYSIENLSKFQETWSSLESFQQHVFQVLIGIKPPLRNEADESLSSERFGANYYARLRDLLAAKDWKAADKETAECMFEVADRQQDRWLRPEDIEQFPCLDLCNIDLLWMKYSSGHFGFSAQKQIWERLGSPIGDDGNWEKFAAIIGWRTKGIFGIGASWLLYSQRTFSELAPKGHLPVCSGVGFMEYEVAILSETISSLASRLSKCSIQ